MGPMPNRIDTAFARLRAARRKAFVAYISAGDPHLDATPDLVCALADAGADVVELGVPFSDPLADGVVNQLAAQRALEAGATLPKLLKTIEAIRRRTEIPLVLFTYLNPLLRQGLGATLRQARDAGADGALILDLPLDEKLGDGAFPDDFRRIQMIAPNTPPERAAALAKGAAGFIYYASREGVTGMRSEVSTGTAPQIATLRAWVETPICVGFGISTPEQARAVAATADGVVIGSALVNQIAAGGKGKDLAARFGAFVRPFAEAIHGE
jgi:tryptophan synthase alpha chain